MSNKHTNEMQNSNTLDLSEHLPYEGDLSNMYYGVHIPSDIQVQDPDGYINVFQDKLEALKVVKKYKKARFKAFSYYHEAAEFAVHGSDCPNNNTTIDGLSFNKLGNESPQAVGEKPSPFRGPKSQDLVKLRKAIEAGDLELVRTTVWDNPRYLISSGDTPSILQEGFRYNALHAATKAKNADMCELILNTVSDLNFVKLLYGDDVCQDAEARASILLDLYLNTPDKGANETPLHFAVKYGALECVKVLTSYPECDRNLKNKHGKLPSMMICERCDTHIPIEFKKKIALLLEESYYVPVLRTEDNCLPPVIGEPFSPKSPPNINSDPLSPTLEVHAYAGPMKKQEAENFRRAWKKIPRALQLRPSKTKILDDTVNSDALAVMRFKDTEKGLERLGKNLANKYRVEWKEYWPFLNSFVDIASSEGLDLLENYLAFRVKSEYSTGKMSNEISGKSSPENSILSPVSDLCREFQAWNIDDHSPRKIDIKLSPREKRNNGPLAHSNLLKQDVSPFLCIEKSCQVFAHRISQDILYLLETDYNNSTTSILENQIKHLELLMTSYMDDNRFSEINFQAVHSRLGSLISNRLRDILKLEDDLIFVCKNISCWLEICNKSLDYFSSDDESIPRHQNIAIPKSTSNNRQVMCLLECVLTSLNFDTVIIDVSTEADCAEVWGKSKLCSCVWQSKGFKRKLPKEEWSARRNLSFENGDSGLNDVNKSIADDASCDIVKGSLEDDEDEFYTPPSSPSLLEPFDEHEDEDFVEAELPTCEIFLEGIQPSRTDYAVFNAIQQRDCTLEPNKYPNVYKWYHCISLYPEEDRQSWPRSSNSKNDSLTSSPYTSTPNKSLNDSSRFFADFHTPPRSRLRIAGIYSPTALFKTNVSAYL